MTKLGTGMMMIFVGAVINFLVVLWLALSVFLVQPSKDRMYEEALLAVGRGDALCADDSANCGWIVDKNREIIDRTIRAGRR